MLMRHLSEEILHVGIIDSLFTAIPELGFAFCQNWKEPQSFKLLILYYHTRETSWSYIAAART